MAKDDIEVEIKIAIPKKKFNDLREQIAKEGTFVKKATQIDEYFTPSHRNFIAAKFPFEWLRLRQNNDKIKINYKHFYPENAEVTSHCDEYETEVGNLTTIEKIFKAIDIKSFAIVEKVRESFIYQKHFEISFDQVKNLGYFIEIEAMHDFGDPQKTRQKLDELARTLKIDPSKCELRGYPYMLMKRKRLI